MTRKDFNPGTLLAPLPAIMVSVGDEQEQNILTVAWCGILSTHPARAYISVRPGRHSHKFLCERGEFVMNLTTEALVRSTDYVGIFTGAKVNKFEKCGLTPQKSKVVAAPTVGESPVALECRVFQVINSGTHDIFLADIVNVSCREDIMDENGRIRLDKAGLITYAHGEYCTLGKKIGKFGFSAAKKKKHTKK
jgi:flavin reductase (DIM6/NTAB) family NADH-FMN oxidoreductase RutF